MKGGGSKPDTKKVESLPPADSHFQISAKVKFQFKAFFSDFSASTARLLETFFMSGVNPQRYNFCLVGNETRKTSL